MIDPRTLSNPAVNYQEINMLLERIQRLEAQVNNRFDEPEDGIMAITFEETCQRHSIFTFEHHTNHDFYRPFPIAKMKKAPGLVFCTNDVNSIPSGGGVLRCPVVGATTPRLIRVDDTSGLHIGDRLHPKSGQLTLEKKTNGSFMAVSEPATNENLIYVVAIPTIHNPIYFGQLAEAMCVTDTTADCDNLADIFTGTVLANTTANNFFGMAGENNDYVLLVPIKNTGLSIDGLGIIVVKHHSVIPLVDVFDDATNALIKGTFQGIAAMKCASTSEETLITGSDECP